ncbi:hypothetical protein TrLO_g12269 [Triparma laevis f. longispina]|uniref:Uncharacterized protein n=1 Tax=Triparma laevis f. longispina TaxID=1714387 RepID=A0A9W7FG84_9STRA|nr:hypothetical protein TrLO_g12269 [Triparma laevis f. longispina]
MSLIARTRQLMTTLNMPTNLRYTTSEVGDPEARYIEAWQKNCIRPNAFYEEHAENRTYFYSVDLQGRLFLEETSPKNIATSLKSDKFLNFFFKQLRWNNTGEFNSYPFFSPCGPEKNYIRPACLPIVFHDMLHSDLIFGGNLIQSFNPRNLAMSVKSGRMFHKLEHVNDGVKRIKTSMQKSGNDWGLVKSSVAGRIAQRIEYKDDTLYYVDDKGNEHKINNLPDEHESESWGLPNNL